MAKLEKIVYYGTGRRKSSIARVRLVEGSGKITINGKTYTRITNKNGLAKLKISLKYVMIYLYIVYTYRETIASQER